MIELGGSARPIVSRAGISSLLQGQKEAQFSARISNAEFALARYKSAAIEVHLRHLGRHLLCL